VLLERLARELVNAGTDAAASRAARDRCARAPRSPARRRHQSAARARRRRAPRSSRCRSQLKEALAQPIGDMRKTDGQLVLGREHASPRNSLVMQTIQRRQRAECWLAAGMRIVRVGTRLGNVVKESDYPLPSRCWGSNRRGTATWIWSKVTQHRHPLHKVGKRLHPGSLS
jgi:hypothetical protein